VQASDHKHRRSTEQPEGRDDVDGSAFSAGIFLIVEERDYIGYELG
jgi:hypothetical protein